MSQLESIKDTVLIRDRVYTILRREILNGGFAPGETLNILNLSKQMGVSCAPVREALNLLNKDGLVELMPYKKAKVAEGTPADYGVAYDMRVMLEPYALDKSIAAIPEGEIVAMSTRLQKMYDEPGSISDFYECDTDFHHLLYSHVDSKMLVSTLDSIRTYTVRYYTQRFHVLVDRYRKLHNDPSISVEETIRFEMLEHMAILDAVEKRDAELACRLLREHISANSVTAIEEPAAPKPAKKRSRKSASKEAAGKADA